MIRAQLADHGHPIPVGQGKVYERDVYVVVQVDVSHSGQRAGRETTSSSDSSSSTQANASRKAVCPINRKMRLAATLSSMMLPKRGGLCHHNFSPQPLMYPAILGSTATGKPGKRARALPPLP